MRTVRPLILVLLVLALAGPGTAGASGQSAGEDRRLYLLASPDDLGYWSTDPADPELGALSIRRTCGGFTAAPTCPTVSAAGSFLNVTFIPAAVREAPITWTPERPLRFRFSLGIQSPAPTTVHAFLNRGQTGLESAAATEVSTGVWEGTIGGSGRIEPGEVVTLGVRVRQPSPVRSSLAIEVRTAGASWIELPDAVATSTVPELLARDRYRARPTSYATPERSFRFNDDDWQAFSFAGDLSADRTFEAVIERPASAVVAWIEGVSRPFVYGLVRGDASLRPPTDNAEARLSMNGEALGSGRPAVAAVDIPAGKLALTVARGGQANPRPYVARIVVVYGARTLAAMRWSFEVANAHLRAPLASICVIPQQPIPVPTEATTFRVDLRADGTSNLLAAWSLAFSVPGFVNGECSSLGNATGARLAVGGPRVAQIGPAPAQNAATFSLYDTRFEAEVVYAHTPPPCQQGEAGCP